MTNESTEQEVSGGEMQTEKQEAEQKVVQTKGKKTEKQFIDDLTTETPATEPDESGRIIVDGAFPQVKRKPVKDKTSNGLERVTY